MGSVALSSCITTLDAFRKTLRVTPAMEAGISDHVWDILDIVKLIPEEEPKKRGNYKKKEIGETL